MTTQTRRTLVVIAALALGGGAAQRAGGQPAPTAAPAPVERPPQASPDAVQQAIPPQGVPVVVPPGAQPVLPPGVMPEPAPTVMPMPAGPAARPAPAVALPAEFAVLMNRNVFAKGGGGPPAPAGPGGPEANFGLKGIACEDGQFTAFVEDLGAKKTLRLKPGDAVGPGRVKSIALSHVEYEGGGKVTRVQVGQNLLGMPLPPPPQPATAPAQGPGAPKPGGPPGPPGQPGPGPMPMPMPPGGPGVPPGVMVVPAG